MTTRMQKRFLLPHSFTATVPAVAAALMLAGCATSPAPREVTAEAPALVLPREVRVRLNGRITPVPLEEYVVGTTLAEVGPVGESEPTVALIFDVQSILARTYAASHPGRHREEGFDLCDTTHCQVYQPGRIATSRFSVAARRAAVGTRGQVLVWAGRLTEALFHADCGGHTASADRIWGGAAVPYLVGTRDAVPPATHRKWQFSVPAVRLEQALNANARTRVGRGLTSLRVIDRDGSGRAAQVEIRGESTRVVRGEHVRAALNETFGPRAIMSTLFSVEGHDGEYRFEGMGFGHGVGLCQVGAAARARRGEPVGAILAAYFPGARVISTR